MGSTDGPTPAATPGAAPTPAASINLSATDGLLAIPFVVTVSGTAASPMGGVAVNNDLGSLGLEGGSAGAFTYVNQPFGGLELYQGFALTASRWDIFWLYCSGTSLTDVWDEGVGGPAMLDATASGTCNAATTSTDAQVSLPALELTTPAPIGGYSIQGANISLAEGETGTLVLDGRSLAFIPFDDVDCSTTCGTPGWYELHSLVLDPAHSRVIFAIVYLIEGTATQVSLEYALSLPDLADPIGNLDLDATWTAAPAAASRRGRGMPPRLIVDQGSTPPEPIRP